VTRLVEEVEQTGGLHVLVNTVHGQFTPKPIAEMSWTDWSVHLDALKAQFLVCQAVLPSMREQRYGRIIYISAGLSKRLFRGCSAYSTVKAGLNAFCKTLAIEEGRYGITVNIVAPGKVVPDDGREPTDNPEDWEALNRQSMSKAPLGREATANDVADAVVYFASRQAGGITGQTLFVAGGEIMP
jgi:3-oxoacyl-[acyl-carrier protein] reductase